MGLAHRLTAALVIMSVAVGALVELFTTKRQI